MLALWVSVLIAASTAPAVEHSPADVAAEVRGVLIGLFAVQGITCLGESDRSRVQAAADRFNDFRPQIEAELDRRRRAELLDDVVSDPSNIYTPGCPPADETERRIANLERAMARLGDALGRGD